MMSCPVSGAGRYRTALLAAVFSCGALAFGAAGMAATDVRPQAVAASQSALPSPRTLRDCPDCPELVVVPAGRFRMGSEDGEKNRPEGPIRSVRIPRPFALGRTEVTVAQFRRFIEQSGHEVAPGCKVQDAASGPAGRVGWRDDPARSWRNPGFVEPQRDDYPVVCVGHTDALAYADWLARATGKAYRLPSEAEWEYAARAGSSSIYSWGNNIDNGCRHANLYDRSSVKQLDFGWSFADCDDGFSELAPVGSLQPNAFGLHDMIGNAWEWVADCYRDDYSGTPVDGRPTPPVADCSRWSVRGGGWMTRPSRQRLSFRGRDPLNAHYSYFGFRVARDLGRQDR